MNEFVKALNTHDSYTWNGAVSHSTTGNSCLDYFAKCGSYRGRSIEEVNADMASIFADDPITAMKIVLYNRMITRKPKGLDNVDLEMHRGQGQKDEFLKSLAWIENNYPKILYDNLWLIPTVGCWKDLWYDSSATNFFYYINSFYVYPLVEQGIQNDYHRQLIAKYLPKIRSYSNVKNERHVRQNDWARGFCRYMHWTEKQYRKFKSNPNNKAHLWQRQMCDNKWNNIDFNTIPGKALFNLISQKGKDGVTALERHGLENAYLDWIKTQPVAKFTGYPYELLEKAKDGGRSLAQKYTYDAQFNELLKKAKENVDPDILNKGVLCALDTSGSMGMNYCMNSLHGESMPAPIDVCLGLGIYFSSLLQGSFHNHVIMFDNKSRFKALKGESFCDKIDQIQKDSTAWGGTNFQSVIDEIVRIRRNKPHIPVEDYPQMLLVVSDMQMNIASNNEKTNYEVAMKKLKAVGLPKMTIVWWNVNGRFTGDVPVKWDDEGTILISGFDGSIVTSLLGGQEEIVDKKTGEKRQKNPQEVMEDCLNQDVLNMVTEGIT